MLRVAAFLVFIVSAAMASGGIILSSRLRARHGHEMFSSLVYFQVFIFTFGFYCIWGNVIMHEFVMPYITGENIQRLSDFIIVLGLPFLIIAMLMLIRFACLASGRKCSNMFVAGFIILNFIAISLLGYVVAGNNAARPSLLIMIYFAALSVVSGVMFAFFIIPGRRSDSPVRDKDRKYSGIGVATILAAQCVPLFFGNPYLGLLFILLFFTGSGFLPIYFSYMAVFTVQKEKEPSVYVSFEEFCRKHDVSPRESEIIVEICNGLSNKEISEKLFISLQTVKDHTHRIYVKTNVRSRAQLMKLISVFNRGI